VDELADEFAGKVKVVKVNVRQAQSVAGRQRIEAIPTLVLYNRGVEVKRLVGLPPGNLRAELKRWVKDFVN
jgi:thioredoxin-like negative regulator of GroEL